MDLIDRLRELAMRIPKLQQDGLADGIAAITTPGRMAEVARNALTWVDEVIRVMRSAPDSPYGDDEEAIAGAILAALEGRKQ